MKNMKRIFTLVLALAMVLGMAVPAMAAQHNVSLNTQGHEYEIYQIFTGDQTDDDATMSNVEWGNGINSTAFLTALKNDADFGTMFTSCDTAAKVAEVLGDNRANRALAERFANLASRYRTVTVKDGEDETVIINDSTRTVDLDSGYYLFVDVTENLGEDHTHMPAMLQVTKDGDILIDKKATVPELIKSVYDGSEAGNQAVQAMIGSTVPFQITTTLPTGIRYFEQYKYVIHDDLPDGVEFVDDDFFKVWLMPNGSFTNKIEVISGYDLKTGNEIGECDVFKGGPDDNSNDTCDLEIVFANLRDPITLKGEGESNTPYTVTNTDKFYVTYNAKVTPAAEEFLTDELVIGKENDAVLEFSNDPNWLDNPENPDDAPPTGFTPEDDAIVYMTKATVMKVDENRNSLAGATFKLEGTSNKPVISYGQQFVETNDFAPGETKYWQLKDDEGNISYTADDPENRSDTESYVDTSKTYALRDYLIETAKTSETSITTTMGEDGVVTFAGLGAGTYTLTEITPPGGYNLLDDSITLVVEANYHPATGSVNFNYIWKDGEITISNNHSVEIINYRGSVLPETGGMGTTLFYVLGGTMALAATVLLITKKRMSAAN